MPKNDLLSPFDFHLVSPTPADYEWRKRLASDLFTVARLAGFTDDHNVYVENYAKYFATLDELDILLNERRYLLGGLTIGASDQWLALLLAFHDRVFYALYKLNRQRLAEFSNLAHYLRDVFSDENFRRQINFETFKEHYFLESELVNPKRRIPLGTLDINSPQDRELRFTPGADESDIEENQLVDAKNGEWKRKISGHRSWVSADGSSGFKAERGRYHLYVANNCPWCHRAALTRQLKGLEDVVSMDVLYYRREPERGWQFEPKEPGCTRDSLFGFHYIRELYEKVRSTETSVPVLWDRETETIVSNESAEIIRMFDKAFGEFNTGSPTLYPDALARQIDRINTFTYHAINNGAYKAGFADSQTAYESAYRAFFDGLETLDHMLRGRRFLLGDQVTEADVRLFPTIFRFDPVYFTRFNLCERMVRDIPSINRWLEEMLSIPEIIAASDLEHCRQGYFGRTGNQIVPLGPAVRS
ncbi:MAG: putative glutathione S-transferase [Gammaproteobacteria bacterium]